MPRRRPDEEGPHPVDALVGLRVKNRRLHLGLSQEELAKALGITFQQVQKYERGANRISFSRMAEICYALKTSMEYFSEGVLSHLPGRPAQRGFAEGKQEKLEPEPMLSKDARELVKYYTGIAKPQLKKQLLEMAKAMSQANDG
jgi:transcriptional regulator with XRE-family HTH domain